MSKFWFLLSLKMGVAMAFNPPQIYPPIKNLSPLVHHSPLRSSAQLSSVSSNEDLRPGITAIVGANEQMMSQLDAVLQTQNFRLYSVDILASCEYMPQELFECYSETCEIYPVDEDQVSVSVI
jgi:Endoplasmic Reticulum Oxidoreductin 1 (ERO1)